MNPVSRRRCSSAINRDWRWNGVRGATGAARTSVVDMTRAFRTNLSALSLLAPVVGVFLIYATISFAVVRRRNHFGMLRALGATGGEILGLVLRESRYRG